MTIRVQADILIKVLMIQLFICFRSVKVAFGILMAFLATAWVTTFTISQYFNYHAQVEVPFALFDELYDKPWTRIGPYLVGMVTGWILFKIKLKMNISKTLACTCWAASILTLLCLVYCLGKTGLHIPYSSIYVRNTKPKHRVHKTTENDKCV